MSENFENIQADESVNVFVKYDFGALIKGKYECKVIRNVDGIVIVEVLGRETSYRSKDGTDFSGASYLKR